MDDIDAYWKNTELIKESVEQKLSSVFSSIDLEAYKREDVASLYEVLALRKSVWLSFFELQNMMKSLDFNVLKQSRF